MKRADLIVTLAVLGSPLYGTAPVHYVAKHEVRQ
jgi:hypothetical protein